MLGPEDRGQARLPARRQTVGNVTELAVHRGRVAHDADAVAVQIVRRQQTVRSQQQRHFTIFDIFDGIAKISTDLLRTADR